MLDFDAILKWLEGVVLFLWSQWQVKVLVCHIAANVVVALAATIRSGDFILGKIPQFLYKKILPLTLVYGVFAVVGETLKMPGISTAVWGLLELSLTNDTLDNLKLLGLEKIPPALTKEREK